MEDNKSTRITFGSALAMVISYTTWKCRLGDFSWIT